MVRTSPGDAERSPSIASWLDSLSPAARRSRLRSVQRSLLLPGHSAPGAVRRAGPGRRYPIVASAERVELGRAFAFADLPIVELAVLDLRTHWAEKLSAYLRRYADRPNTRVKDLVDLVLLIEHGLEPDARLDQATTNTFARRQQDLPGEQLPSMADEWAEPFEAMAVELGLGTATAAHAHAAVEMFWQDVLRHDQPKADENGPPS